ncbi:MAG: NUDIX domain-containing protein [Firmicutes bacterium]|nr:NUDIX domain-containing protein [Bacillota bacterium]
MTREWSVATFVVHQERVLLLYHRQLQKWLPPGGHIEPNELPCEAAVREVWEETKVLVELVGEKALSVSDPRQLILPRGIQLETIDDDHQHIDLVYFARVLGDPTPTGNSESSAVGWYGREDWPKMGLTYEIQQWVELAVREVKN